MKIKMNKNLTESWMVDEVKSAMKEFKARYTDGDLKRAFEDATQSYQGYTMDIVRTYVEAFDAGFADGYKPCFCVDMLLEGYSMIVKYRFYADIDLNVNTGKTSHGESMYSVTVYEEREA